MICCNNKQYWLGFKIISLENVKMYTYNSIVKQETVDILKNYKYQLVLITTNFIN